MAISWDSIRALAIFFAPVLIPRALSYYRSVRSASARHGLQPIQPAPPAVRLALAGLSLLAILLALLALPTFAPENIFLATQSRLQTPPDVLFTRLAALRGATAAPDPRDALLRTRFASLQGRLLYLHLGPSVLADCPFCHPDDPRSYLLYAAPALLAPHLANLAALAAALGTGTGTGTGSGTGRRRWRSLAVAAAAGLAALDVYLVASYPLQRNARALRLPDVDFFFWRARAARLLALAALDAALAALLWVSATNRAFARPRSPAERVDMLARGMVAARARLSALGIVKNTVARDDALRGKSHAYWVHEVRLMGEVMEEREVVEGVNDALANRIDIVAITRDAEHYAGNVLGPLE